jgi:capsular polysaccharide export protein
MKENKVVLFLQGPHSWFFARLADKLEQLGQRSLRINLCFSDWLFWPKGGAYNYRGSLEDWGGYLDRFLAEHGVTDIVLLGEQRPHHRVAVDLAAKHDIHVTVTEWGYLRPDWITFERDGMSGNTRFPKCSERVMELAHGVPPPDFALKYPDSFVRMACNGLAGDLGNWLLAFLYPGYRSHLVANPVVLYAATGARMAKARLQRRSSESIVQRLVSESPTHPFFVFPMQIEADYQVRSYSPFAGMEEALKCVISSFARFAPAPARLLIKVHPMDPGFKPWKKIIDGLAAEHGAPRRVIFVDGGSFGEIAAASAGIVTVNSTCGVQALKCGKPVKTLGQSVYDIPGLTHAGELDSFWCSAQKPEPKLCDAYIKAMSACIQIKGGFFSAKGVEAAARIAATRLTGNLVNAPLKDETLEVGEPDTRLKMEVA